jgi:hypothetical protein
MNNGPKNFILRKYVTAMTAADAIKQDRKTPVSEVFLDEQKDNRSVADAIGFHAPIDPCWRDDEIRNGQK